MKRLIALLYGHYQDWQTEGYCRRQRLCMTRAFNQRRIQILASGSTPVAPKYSKFPIWKLGGGSSPEVEACF